MQIFVVNLKIDIVRYESISIQLKNSDLSAEVIEAVDGRKLTEDGLAEIADRNFVCEHFKRDFILTPGEIGCAASHKKIYDLIIERKIPYALVLEDDVQLPLRLKNTLEHIELWIKQKKYQGLILLHYFRSQPEPLFLRFRGRNRFKGIKFYRVDTAHVTGSGAYVITYEAAKKLRALNTPIKTVADDHVYFSKYIMYRAIWPRLMTLSYLSKESSIRGHIEDVPLGKKAFLKRQLGKDLYERFRFYFLVLCGHYWQDIKKYLFD